MATNMDFFILFPIGNPMEWVHGTWTGQQARVHGGPGGGMDKRHDGASTARCAQALGAASARQWWPVRTKRMRRCH
jgi:hypothetical protein